MPKERKSSAPGLDILGMLTALKPFVGESGQGMIDRALEMAQALTAALAPEGGLGGVGGLSGLGGLAGLTGLTGSALGGGELPSNVQAMVEDVKQSKAQGMSLDDILAKYDIDPATFARIASLVGGLRGLGGLKGFKGLRGVRRVSREAAETQRAAEQPSAVRPAVAEGEPSAAVDQASESESRRERSESAPVPDDERAAGRRRGGGGGGRGRARSGTRPESEATPAAPVARKRRKTRAPTPGSGGEESGT